MDFWDRVAGLYDFAEALNGSVYNRMLRCVRALVPEGAKVLDVAAGTGALSIVAAEKAESVRCTDLSAEMLKQAQKKARKLGIDNIVFGQRNIFHLEDEDNTYDVVMAGNVLHLLDNPHGALRELYRVTKPGGLLLLPTFMSKRKGRWVIEAYKLLGFRPSENYDTEEYRAMLKSAGLGKIKTKLIDGLVPCCFAVMKKPAEQSSNT